MSEYIEREAVLAREYLGYTRYTETEWQKGYWDGVDDLCAHVKELPAADVAPVRHAKWDDNNRCTNCGVHAPYYEMSLVCYLSPYCFECGAMMDLEVSDG